MKLPNKILPVMLVVTLAACQTMHGERQTLGTPSHQPAGIPLPPEGPAQQPAPVQLAPPQIQPLPNYPKTAADISGPAVTALMRQANIQRAAGNLPQAAATLGRALRIEPRNYFVWSALASTYLDQKVYDQAENVALKSNSLARGNVYVDLQNWGVIRDARTAEGNVAGAADAQARIDAIQQMLLQAAPPAQTGAPPPANPPPN
ncbi:MAG: hypothetical protein ACRESS_04655 [Stenotrophobium sp.]